MTFAQYYNDLLPYLSNGDEKRTEFFDDMIEHFIYKEYQNSCGLLNCMLDTKTRYIKKKNANKIKPDYAAYAYSKHDPQRYRKWLHDRMFDQDSFYSIENWLEKNEIEYRDVCEACDELLENILFEIGYPNVSDGEVTLPPADNTCADSDRLTVNDRKLLKDFCFDYDRILEKCIKSDPAEAWFTGRISSAVDKLYNEKWQNRIVEFENIRLQSDLLSTIATLRELCDALDPDKEKAPVSPIRKLRIELRNCYVKIHPDKYAGLFPYEAFIDDWNDEE